jgi:PAS domain S-box-containing protein
VEQTPASLKKDVGSLFDRYHGLAFATALALLAAVGILSYRSTLGLIETQGRMNHTQEMIDRLDELVAQATEAESATRAYALSRDVKYRDAFHAASSRIESTLRDLQQLTPGRDAQAETLIALRSALSQRLTEQARSLEMRTATGALGSEAVLSGRGHILKQQIGDLAARMKDRERSLLRERTRRARQEAERSTWGLTAGSLLSFAVLSIVYYQLTREIASRKRSEQGLMRSNRLYAVLSEVNQAIVRVRDRDTIFRDLCRIAVEHGRYRVAWAGTIAPGSPGLRREAYASLDGDGPEWLDCALEMEQPVERAVCNDLASDTCRLAWRAEAQSRGFSSAVLLPIMLNGQAAGALALCAAETGAFGEPELMLLHEVASDVAFALENLDRDVRRRQAEDSLQESEERFRQMADNIHEVFWMADTRTARLLYVSPAYEHIWGRSCESAYIQSPAEALAFIHPEDREAAVRARGALLAKEAYDYEFRLVRPDGSVRWIWDRSFPVRDQSGQVYRCAGIARDVTERKAATLALRARVAQQRAVAELGQRAVESQELDILLAATVARVADVLNVECCKILELLPNGEALLLRAGVGWKEGAVGTVTVGTARDSQAGYTLIASQPVIVTDFRTETRFREPFLLQDNNVLSGISVLIGEAQHPFGVLGAHSTRARTFSEDDVHFLQAVASLVAAAIRRTQAEEEIQRLNRDLERRVEKRTGELALLNRELAARNQEVERANRLKSEFLATMSHELRTPLNSVIGFTELLARKKPGPLNTKQERFLGNIDEAARHLLQLINDILDLSRIEAGRTELRCEHFDVAESLGEVLAVIRPLAGMKRLDLAADVAPGTVIYADRIRFKQMLYNLLSNAVKFTPEGGRVWVECAVDAAGVRLTVADTGIGIAAEEQDAIFEQFRQVGVTTSGVREGTGLGLAITKRLVELHSGRIWVESRPGAGSRFLFLLPNAAQSAYGAGQGGDA